MLNYFFPREIHPENICDYKNAPNYRFRIIMNIFDLIFFFFHHRVGGNGGSMILKLIRGFGLYEFPSKYT